MKKRNIAGQDRHINLAPHPTDDTNIMEFVNGTVIRVCVECGADFIGVTCSFLCYKCLMSIHNSQFK